MGSDQRIRGHILFTRCCYGACLGFGFCITAITLAAMFWIVWCYFGLSVIHFSDTQRRAIVDYSYTTAKPHTTTSAPIRNTLPDALETSVNQISKLATAASNAQRNEPPLNAEKWKEVNLERDSHLAKGDFASRERFNGTVDLDPKLKRSSANETRREQTPNDSTRRNIGSEFSLAASKSFDRNSESSSSNPRKEGQQLTRNDNTTATKEITYAVKDTLGSSVSNSSQTARDSTNTDPNFERENPIRSRLDEVSRGYDIKDTSGRDRISSEDGRYSKGDTRFLPESATSSRGGLNEEDRYRDTTLEDDRHLAVNPTRSKDDSHKSIRVDIDRESVPEDSRYSNVRKDNSYRYSDTPIRESEYKDKFSDEVRDDIRRTHEDRSIREERFREKVPEDIRYTSSRRGDRVTYENRPLREDRYDDRPLRTDRYSDRPSREDKYDDRPLREDRYEDRPSREDKYDDRPLREDRYEDRPLRTDRYDDRALRRDRYDDRPLRNDRYDDRPLREDRYDGRPLRDARPLRTDKYDDRPLRTDRYDDRPLRRDKYDDRPLRTDRYDDRPTRTDKYDDRSLREDRDDERSLKTDKYDDRALRTDKYDDRPISTDRRRETMAVSSRNLDKFSDEREKSEGRKEYDDKTIVEEQYRERISKEDRPIDRYPEEGKQREDSGKFYDRSLVEENRNRDRIAADRSVVTENRNRDRTLGDRYRDETKRNSEDQYRNADYKERVSDKDDRPYYVDSGSDKVIINRDRSDESLIMRDSDIDKYDDRLIDRSRDRASSRYEPKEVPYRSYIDDDKLSEGSRPSIRGDSYSLMSSRTDYRPTPVKTRPSRQDYNTKTEMREIDRGIIEKDYSSTYRDEDSRISNSDTTANDRYRSGDNKGEIERPARYNDRDRIAPTRVKDSSYISRNDRDEVHPSSFENRRRGESLYPNEQRSMVRNTKYQVDNDRSRTPGIRIDSSTDFDDDKREYRSKPLDDKDDLTKAKNEDVVLDRRSYSSEEIAKSRISPDSGDRGDRPPYDDRTRDYRDGDSRREYYEEHDEYRSRNRQSQNMPNNRNRDTRNGDSSYDSVVENQSNRNRDNSEKTVDRNYRDRMDNRRTSNRDKYDPVGDGYVEDRYDDRYEPRTDDRYFPTDDKIRIREPDGRPIIRDAIRGGLTDSKSTRYPLTKTEDEPSRYSPISRDRQYSSDSLNNPLPSANSRNFSPPRSTRRDTPVGSRGIEDDADQPLSAKDVIEAALRHSETSEQNSKKVFYPVFDPSLSNLTSPHIIRPSERRGTTITAKKKRK